MDRADGDFKSAERHFTEAYNKWISGDNLLSDPFCGACVYRMGCTALDQGKIESAMYVYPLFKLHPKSGELTPLIKTENIFEKRPSSLSGIELGCQLNMQDRFSNYRRHSRRDQEKEKSRRDFVKSLRVFFSHALLRQRTLIARRRMTI